MIAIQAAKPEKSPKGQFIKAATITSTMGPGIPIDVSTITPNSPRFMRDLVFDKATASRTSSLPNDDRSSTEQQNFLSTGKKKKKTKRKDRNKPRPPPPNPATYIHYQQLDHHQDQEEKSGNDENLSSSQDK